MRDVLAATLLVLGATIVVASCVGMAVLRDPLDRIHLLTPASTVGVLAVCAAVVARDGLDPAGTAALLTAFVSVGFSPFVAHATARSIVVRRGTGGGRDRPPGTAPAAAGEGRPTVPGGDR